MKKIMININYMSKKIANLFFFFEKIIKKREKKIDKTKKSI